MSSVNWESAYRTLEQQYEYTMIGFADTLEQRERELLDLERRARSAESAVERIRGEAMTYRRDRDRNAHRLRTVEHELKSEIKDLRKRLKKLRRRKVVRVADYLGRVRKDPAQLRRVFPVAGRVSRRVARKFGFRKAPQAAVKATSAQTVSLVPWHSLRKQSDYPEADQRDTRARASASALGARLDGTRSLRVAAISDEFTADGFGFECDFLNLHRERWLQQIEAHSPDLLFVESAWRGAEGSWHNAVSYLPDDLREMIQWCRDRAIPTVFWNKEDPVHFDTFLTLAAEFDYVFTTDIDMVVEYARELGHSRVSFLPFASQPKRHNPIEHVRRKPGAVLAGSYYRKYARRARDLNALFDGAQGLIPVDIYDRNYGTTNEAYQFPARYLDHVVGTLSAEEVDVAYKGYDLAFNLNTVKSSNSMFARRVFELLTSGTPVLSNYSRGVEVMFGDLVAMSDSSDHIADLVRLLTKDTARRERLRTVALRKALQEHTYGERMRMIVAAVTSTEYEPARPEVVAVGQVSGIDELTRFLSVADRQRGVTVSTIVVTAADDVERAALAQGLRVIRTDAGEMDRPAEGVSAGLPIAVLDLEKSYGDEYLLSLAQAMEYSDAPAIVKSELFVLDGEDVQWSTTYNPFKLSREATVKPWMSLLVGASIQQLSLRDVLAGEVECLTPVEVLAVDGFDYCDGVLDVPAADVITAAYGVDDRGYSLSEMLQRLQTQLAQLDQVSREGDVLLVDPSSYPRWAPAGSKLRIIRQGFSALHVSRLDDVGNASLPISGVVPVAPNEHDGAVYLTLEARGDLGIRLKVKWQDTAGKHLRSDVLVTNDCTPVIPPAEADHFTLSLEVKGVGATVVRGILLGRVARLPDLQFDDCETLMLSSAYPSYDDLYKYGFVHSRVRAYRSEGLDVSMYRWQPNGERTYYEFDGTVVRSGGSDDLRRILDSGRITRVAVHFLTEALWNVLKEYADRISVTVWIHGAEVQPWWRRRYASEARLQHEKKATVRRQQYWRDVLDSCPAKMGFVFVSEYFRDEVSEDLERQFPADRTVVIHNPIDTELFNYVEKTDDQRMRVLSIRPYENPKYANDLAVAAVVSLSKEEWFEELEFVFIGDGQMFDEVLAPVRDFANVEIRRQFLDQREIARLHKDYGVFLVPTRVDAQGVSRDEAMSSGLVPVTSHSTAVPEFVSDAEGYLAPAEDSDGLADAIRELRDRPEVFKAKSAAAAARVRRQSSADIVVPQEIEFLLRDGGQPVREE